MLKLMNNVEVLKILSANKDYENILKNVISGIIGYGEEHMNKRFFNLFKDCTCEEDVEKILEFFQI